MTQSRIDNLRHMVAAIGEQQREYYRFFPGFADRLESELGDYFGDPSCVALSSAMGEFTFEQGSYRHAGIGFDHGRFRIPIMFRLKNLKDQGDLVIRILMFFSKQEDDFTAQIDGQSVIHFQEQDLEPLYKYVYQHLQGLFEKQNWFTEVGAEYAGSSIGFLRGNNAT